MMGKATNQLFIELLQVSLNTRTAMSRIPTAEEWDELYLLAEGNCVGGICFQGIVKLVGDNAEGYRSINLSEECFHQWAAISYNIVERNKIVSTRCCTVQRKLKEKGLASVIIKGQGLHPFYGDLAKYRQPGDIDVWIDGQADDVLDFAMRLTPTKEFDWKHTHLHVYRDTLMELHWRPSVAMNPIINRRLTEFYDAQAKLQCHRSTADSEGNPLISSPDATFNSVYLMIHLYSHYVYDRVNVRQLMDYYFVLTSDEAQKNRDEIVRQLKHLGLNDFAKHAMALLKLLFNVDESLLLCKHDDGNMEQSLSDLFCVKAEMPNSQNKGIRSVVKRLNRMLTYDKVGLICMPFRKLQLAIWKRGVKRRFNL